MNSALYQGSDGTTYYVTTAMTNGPVSGLCRVIAHNSAVGLSRKYQKGGVENPWTDRESANKLLAKLAEENGWRRLR